MTIQRGNNVAYDWAPIRTERPLVLFSVSPCHPNNPSNTDKQQFDIVE
jgi:hypothetical protein